MPASRLPFSVSAPASSGNLGPGFDVLAMALSLRNRVHVKAGTGRVVVQGHGTGSLPEDATNLVARAFEIAAARSISDAEVDLRCDNRIPPARGLGSSTAAAACGLIAGWEVAGSEWDEHTLCTALTELDGHPDNAAACAHGGIVLCHDTSEGLDIVPLGAADWIAPVAVVPDRELSTTESRAALPDTFERSDVVKAIGAAGLLVGGLLGGHPELVEEALHADVVHEPHRARLVPELGEVRDAIDETKALGATLSGAGPTVLVWCEPADAAQAVGSLSIDFPDSQVLSLACAAEGARVD